MTVLHLSHPEYPESLRQIYDPPPVLYVRGSLPDQVQGDVSALRSVGIVGTRDAGDYALELTRTLARDLAGAGVAIISGLALGVDSAAHGGAMSVEGGRTVAVLGSGVDVIYPRQNDALARKILDGHGALVSEYRVGTGPRAENFPGRNRIIYGLSRGVAVVEAGVKSGALITADYAVDEGRTVFAVPGRRPARGRDTGVAQNGGGPYPGRRRHHRGVRLEGVRGGRCPADRGHRKPGWAKRQLLEAVSRQGSPLLDDLMDATGMSAPELLPQLALLEL